MSIPFVLKLFKTWFRTNRREYNVFDLNKKRKLVYVENAFDKPKYICYNKIREAKVKHFLLPSLPALCASEEKGRR
jgi:hypothetical protein